MVSQFKMKFTYTSYTWLKANFMKHFNSSVHETKFHGLDFSTCNIIFELKFQILEHFRLRIFRSGLLRPEEYPTWEFLKTG